MRDQLAAQQQVIEATLSDMASDTLDTSALVSSVSGLLERMMKNRQTVADL